MLINHPISAGFLIFCLRPRRALEGGSGAICSGRAVPLGGLGCAHIMPAKVLLIAMSSISRRMRGSVQIHTSPASVPMKRY